MLACACLPACAYACVLPPRSVASCLCAFCSTKLDAKALVAAVCQHVDPTIACETFWQHQYKQQQPSKASAARVCVRSSIVVVVIYVIFQNFCLAVWLTHSRSTKQQRGVVVGVGVCLLLLLLHWSGLVSYSSSLATLRSALLLFRFTLSFATFCAVRSCLLQCLRCGRVFSLMLPLSAASASCQVILLFLS